MQGRWALLQRKLLVNIEQLTKVAGVTSDQDPRGLTVWESRDSSLGHWLQSRASRLHRRSGASWVGNGCHMHLCLQNPFWVALCPASLHHAVPLSATRGCPLEVVNCLVDRGSARGNCLETAHVSSHFIYVCFSSQQNRQKHRETHRQAHSNDDQRWPPHRFKPGGPVMSHVDPEHWN